jgi:predicted DNA-binding transcriptional regulator AlpA
MNEKVFVQQTLTKHELLQYLGFGSHVLTRMLKEDSSFPKPKPYMNRWSKPEVDRWLISDNQKPKESTGTDIHDYVNWW